MEYNDGKREKRIMQGKESDGVGMGGQDKWGTWEEVTDTKGLL